MATEVELKLRLAAPDVVRQRLIAAGARPTGHALQHDVLFDTSDETLRQSDRGLRLRQSRPLGVDAPAPVQVLLTFKGPRAPSNLKSRLEVETPVDDAGALHEILAGLGYHPAVRLEKRRETWALDDCEVALDELPQLGWFVEIEGPNEPTIRSTAARLDLGDESPLAGTYVELAATHGTPKPDGCAELLFGSQ